jgi:hypothetical protein
MQMQKDREEGSEEEGREEENRGKKEEEIKNKGGRSICPLSLSSLSSFRRKPE